MLLFLLLLQKGAVKMGMLRPSAQLRRGVP
jgi:hypothetical protein